MNQYMEGKFESFSAELNTMRTSLDFWNSSKSWKCGNGVLDGKEEIEKLLPAKYQTINSDLMKKGLDRCTVEYIARAYKVQFDIAFSICPFGWPSTFDVCSLRNRPH